MFVFTQAKVVLLLIILFFTANFCCFSKQSLEVLKNDNDFKDYMRRLELQIKGNWQPYSSYNAKAVVFFRVYKDGTMSDLKIKTSSGRQQMDNEIIGTVYNATPFEPLPASFAGSSIDVEFTFEKGNRRTSRGYINNKSNGNIPNNGAYKISKEPLFNNTEQNANRRPILKMNMNNRLPSQPIKQYRPQQQQYFSSIDFIKKNPSNPMRWNYDAKYGSYAASQIMGNNKDLTHFLDFPIKYWIEPVESVWQQPVRDAIKEFSFYFPMVEVKKKRKADLTIEYVGFKKLQSVSQNAIHDGVKAIGGYKSSTARDRYGNKYLNSFKSYVYVLNSSFSDPDIRHVVLHELGHAFGIIEHSRKDTDIMYPSSSLARMDGKVINTNKVNNLSPRDLNTLFIIYNNW